MTRIERQIFVPLQVMSLCYLMLSFHVFDGVPGVIMMIVELVATTDALIFLCYP